MADPVNVRDLVVDQEFWWDFGGASPPERIWWRLTVAPHDQGSDIISLKAIAVDDEELALQVGIDASIDVQTRGEG